MENKKKIIMVVLSVLVCVMAVGYAVLAQQLNISGKISIDSTWKVEITNITEKDIVGDASSKVEPTYTATTANFSVGLIQPGDSITYDIEVTNSGTLDAILEDIDVTLEDNDAIIYTTSGLEKGAKLSKNSGKNTLSIKVEYNPNVTSQPTNIGKGLTVTINYEQDLGQSIYDSYSIGDIITFAGSDWYVIKNSTSHEDYVTLLKEKVLTNEELGEYAANHTCTAENVTKGTYKCTKEGQIIKKYDMMSYYWDDTCHISGYYGYSNYDYSGYGDHNDYKGSKARELLEKSYINTLGSENLKEIDGYKIRLAMTEELESNGWLGTLTICTGSCYGGYGIIRDNAPDWLYNDFGWDESNTQIYWTMTPKHDDVLAINDYGQFGSYSYMYSRSAGQTGSIRPVINLLKSSI